ncbi:MerR family transcriptional regulator [Rhodanobacter sp. L36]|uniref:helix-turn-helix domain-containing protein n=1 Tax=Rhodanobacter sp. L36 TaxID=1747221 RepID=UPI00131C9456|nr:MerR family transcriptional regulator [Rhodanobacter sp. L36]
MLIADFCRRADLTRDAVRLYVKLGLLTPNVGVNASNRYQQFTDKDLNTTAVIRTAQQLGFTLRQIVTFNKEYESGAMDRKRKLAIMRSQLEAFDIQAERMRAMRKYLRAKVAWLEGGERGVEPAFRGARC